MPRLPVISSLLAALAALPLAVAPAHASTPDDDSRHSFVVVGDLPYGDAALAALPGWIRDINASDPDFTVHLGDIKSGSSLCTTSYFRTIRAQLDTFTGPLVYTPGDNEWTDCHRPAAGGFSPLERLAEVRRVFFDRPGRTLGQKPMTVRSQARLGLPENVTFSRHDIAFAALHVVGSNNDLVPWDGLGNTTTTSQQRSEEATRMSAGLAEVRATFARARAEGDRAVVLFQQADMFDPTFTPTPADISAFTPLVRTLVAEAAAFPGETYLFNGDSHVANADRPLAAGSVWLQRYGVTGSADGLQRLTVDGSSNAGLDYLRVTVNPEGSEHVLGFARVPYSPPAP